MTSSEAITIHVWTSRQKLEEPSAWRLVGLCAIRAWFQFSSGGTQGISIGRSRLGISAMKPETLSGPRNKQPVTHRLVAFQVEQSGIIYIYGLLVLDLFDWIISSFILRELLIDTKTMRREWKIGENEDPVHVCCFQHYEGRKTKKNQRIKMK